MEAGPPLSGLHLATASPAGSTVRQVDRLSGVVSACGGPLHRLACGRTVGPSERRDAASSLKPQQSIGSMTESVPVKSGSWTRRVQLGIKPFPEALAIAKELDLDLVQVAPMANPPVCRIMDFGKFKFDEAQRAKESRRKTVHVGIKEMKYRPKSALGLQHQDPASGQVPGRRAQGQDHDHVPGREVYHPEHGKRILDRIAEQMEGVAKVEAEPSSTTAT